VVPRKRAAPRAAENFHGDVARQIGGAGLWSRVFSAILIRIRTCSGRRQVADGRIVIFNGADYDPWMQKMLDAVPRAGRAAISVAAVVGWSAGEILISGTIRREVIQNDRNPRYTIARV
jgi:zinc/manganese transport system substrate-binding protein